MQELWNHQDYKAKLKFQKLLMKLILFEPIYPLPHLSYPALILVFFLFSKNRQKGVKSNAFISH